MSDNQGLTNKAQGMKCLIHFCTTSMKGDISAHLRGGGELHEGIRVITLGALQNLHKASKRVIKMIKSYSS